VTATADSTVATGNTSIGITGGGGGGGGGGTLYKATHMSPNNQVFERSKEW
jgi:hypothetical protein